MCDVKYDIVCKGDNMIKQMTVRKKFSMRPLRDGHLLFERFARTCLCAIFMTVVDFSKAINNALIN